FSCISKSRYSSPSKITALSRPLCHSLPQLGLSSPLPRFFGAKGFLGADRRLCVIRGWPSSRQRQRSRRTAARRYAHARQRGRNLEHDSSTERQDIESGEMERAHLSR